MIVRLTSKCIVLAFGLLLGGGVLSLPVCAQSLPPETPQRLKGMAEQFEKDGHKREAADVYERLILKDPSTRRIVAPQLVRLYIETRQPGKALEWAKTVSADMPEPQAYLAGVYAQLGGYNEARSILNREIETVRNVNRKVALLWQMADLCGRTGDMKGAHRALAEAVEISAGHPEFPTAHRRLTQYESRHGIDAEKPAPQPGEEAGQAK